MNLVESVPAVAGHSGKTDGNEHDDANADFEKPLALLGGLGMPIGRLGVHV